MNEDNNNQYEEAELSVEEDSTDKMRRITRASIAVEPPELQADYFTAVVSVEPPELQTDNGSTNGHTLPFVSELKSETAHVTRGTAAVRDLPIRRIRVHRILKRKRHHKYSSLRQDFTVRLLQPFVAVSMILFLLLSASAGAVLGYYQPALNNLPNHIPFQTTHVYDRNGHLLYELYNPQYGRRTYVNYNDISPILIQAAVAAEDRTFWTNSGVDLQGITRAVITNLQNRAVVEGGSTITQQLIKNGLFPDAPRTVPLKLQEAILASALTEQYPKWKIMELYLNAVYYGDLNYGIEAAAQNYFGLQPQCSHTVCQSAASQLDLAQASLLAGLLQSPSNFNPIVNKPAALYRQSQVLQAMVELRTITNAQKLQAQQEMAQYTFKSFVQGIQAPHFVHYVIDQVLVPLLGAENLLDGGYNIYTTLDLDLEKKVEQITYDDLYKTSLNTIHNVNNAAVVVMNPVNGEILAMNGSANYKDTTPSVRGQYNGALALRQPGSSIKLLVYASAFEMGWYPATILPDHKTTYPAGAPPDYYTPRNYDGKFHQGFPMTIRNAISNSFNIPAVDTIEYIGVPSVLNMAGRLGLTELANRPPSGLGPSLALGAAEVSLLHLTGAYATFANRGVHVPSTSILEITDSKGHPLYTYNALHPAEVRAVREDVAFLMSSMLSDKASRYHEFPPGNALELDRPAAAKTGTTDSFRDNWTMGYTPHLTVGVWAGNSDNTPMYQVGGITGAGPIWHDVMEYASQRYKFPPDDFIRPPNVHAGTVSAQTGLLPYPGEPTITDWFIDGTLPTIQGEYPTTSPICIGDICLPSPPLCIGNICAPLPVATAP